jgi:hypothetical protein
MSPTGSRTASLRRLAAALLVPTALIGSALVLAPDASADTLVATTSSLDGPRTLAPGDAGAFFDTVLPASPGGPTLTGNVTFVQVDINTGATTVLGEVPVDDRGYAILVSPFVGYGTFGVHAYYSGDSAYQDSWSGWVYPDVVAPGPGMLQIDPAPVDLGSHAVGSRSATAITLTNRSQADWSLSGLSTDSDDVFIDSSSCDTLAPQASCTAGVVFTPAEAGPVSATLSFVSNFGTSRITATGTGVAPDASALAVTPNPVAFGNQAVGSVSTRSVTLTNTASIPWTVSAIGLTSDAVTWASLPCTTLAPGASCTATVRFAPTAAGPVSATLGLGSNFGTSWITVTGTGVAPAPAPAPVITRISPAKGSHNGGTLVTITGRNFTGVTAIRIGGVLMRSVSCSSSTTCTAITPRGTGTKAIRVTAGGRTSALAAADRFTYL